MSLTSTLERAADAAPPFAPEGVTFHGVSRNLVTARVITCIAWCALPLAAGVFFALRTSPWFWLVALLNVAIILWELWLAPRQVRMMGYAEREDDLLVRKGILFKSLVVVPYGRMQMVDVTAGPLQRALGIATVQLHTASASTDATIPGLPPVAAELLRDRLAERGQARLAGL